MKLFEKAKIFLRSKRDQAMGRGEKARKKSCNYFDDKIYFIYS